MALVRVMAIFQGGSNLPEDRFINTFHFSTHPGVAIPPVGAATFEEVKVGACGRVRDFFQEVLTFPALGMMMSPYINRIWNIQAYDLELPPGERTPYVETGNFGAVSHGGLPEEVAICTTLQGAPPVTPRRRGRLYIGPLGDTTNVIDVADATNPARPEDVGASAIVLTINEKCTSLATDSPPFDLHWCIRSVTPSENFVKIVSGYTDNAFDTQRRRGPDTTARQTWTN